LQMTSDSKKEKSRKEGLNYWIEQYLQAKAMGDKTKAKMFEAIILKLNGKIPRL